MAVALFLAVLAGSGVGQSRAQEAETALAAEHVLEFSRALAEIAEDGATLAERAQRVDPLIAHAVSIAALARYVAGAAWDAADSADREAYRSAYRTYLAAAVARQMADYAGESVALLASRPIGGQDSLVTTRIVSADRNRVVQWRVRAANGGLLILDILVDGTSLARTQREDFAAIAEAGGLAELTGRLHVQTQRLLAGRDG